MLALVLAHLSSVSKFCFNLGYSYYLFQNYVKEKEWPCVFLSYCIFYFQRLWQLIIYSYSAAIYTSFVSWMSFLGIVSSDILFHSWSLWILSIACRQSIKKLRIVLLNSQPLSSNCLRLKRWSMFHLFLLKLAWYILKKISTKDVSLAGYLIGFEWS